MMSCHEPHARVDTFALTSRVTMRVADFLRAFRA